MSGNKTSEKWFIGLHTRHLTSVVPDQYTSRQASVCHLLFYKATTYMTPCYISPLAVHEGLGTTLTQPHVRTSIPKYCEGRGEASC